MKRVISILVEDRTGTLARVVELFTSRGYNLDSVCTGESETHGVHRMTIVTDTDEKRINHILKLLNNLVYVREVRLLAPGSTTSAELMLVKLQATAEKRSQVLELVHAYHGQLIEMNHRCISFQLVGSASQLDGAAEVFAEFEILELARTGEAAIHK